MKNNGRKILQALNYIFAAVGVAAIVYGTIFSGSSGGMTRTVSAQQDPFLAQRLSQIESRFNSFESRLYRLEAESRLPAMTTTPRTTQNYDTQINLLNSQLETLFLRLATLECGLVKLDERTLTDAARRARKNSAVTNADRCRLNPNTPLQISVPGAE